MGNSGINSPESGCISDNFSNNDLTDRNQLSTVPGGGKQHISISPSGK